MWGAVSPSRYHFPSTPTPPRPYTCILALSLLVTTPKHFFPSVSGISTERGDLEFQRSATFQCRVEVDEIDGTMLPVHLPQHNPQRHDSRPPRGLFARRLKREQTFKSSLSMRLSGRPSALCHRPKIIGKSDPGNKHSLVCRKTLQPLHRTQPLHVPHVA